MNIRKNAEQSEAFLQAGSTRLCGIKSSQNFGFGYDMITLSI